MVGLGKQFESVLLTPSMEQAHLKIKDLQDVYFAAKELDTADEIYQVYPDEAQAERVAQAWERLGREVRKADKWFDESPKP